MLKQDAIWPYLEYKCENIRIIIFPSPNLSYVSFHVVQNDKTLYKSDLVSVKELRENLKKTEFYEFPMIRVKSEDIRKLLDAALTE